VQSDNNDSLANTDGVHQIRGLSQILPRLCGPSNAKLASLASMPITATKALSWNIVSEVVEVPADLLPAAMRITKGIAYNKGPILRALKKTMNEAYELSYGEARKLELTSDKDYYESLGGDKARVLNEGANRFNKRVKELDTTGMQGGMLGED
jgi:enoyl-CoA hydratase/carnithine racemase